MSLSPIRQQELISDITMVLDGKVGIIFGSRLIQQYRFDLDDDGNDKDFGVFVLVDSDTDHLPVDNERDNWSAEALVRKDREIAEAEDFYRKDVFHACEVLLDRFGDKLAR